MRFFSVDPIKEIAIGKSYVALTEFVFWGRFSFPGFPGGFVATEKPLRVKQVPENQVLPWVPSNLSESLQREKKDLAGISAKSLRVALIV
jgi:hypothetical protein